ncbi:hypothetical protein [uncultured Pseudokineococcus sp.]|uniref:hypothetical protein n=1 Tax=uncultured Pseudokineococcus sp. TaxID=1642928 RepID=UPI00261BD577|nr:hypothetical protein [uncultured Pseudokineococcus sp.]
MAEQGLFEVQHLERWVVDHPEILGANVKVVSQQYSTWATSTGKMAAERLDILALDASGQLVVVELKRDGDKRVHLQALTYAALVAGFTKGTLAEAHALHLSKTSGAAVSTELALGYLEDHVEGGWDDDLLTRPKVVLIAERFPLQVMTTVRWLAELSPSLSIECIELTLFSAPGESAPLCATFQTIFPIDDLTDRILSPTSAVTSDVVSVEIAKRKRRQRSVQVIVEHKLVPTAARLSLSLETLLRPDVVAKVNAWMGEDPARSVVTWRQDATRPLHWAAEPDVPGWSATKLAQHIIEQATETASRPLSGPDAWMYGDNNLYGIAEEHLSSEASEGL